MNYQTIRDLAMNYADRRDDPELRDPLTGLLTGFTRIVETRVERVLQTRHQAKRARIHTRIDREYYPLPDDFNGLRDIEVRSSITSQDRITAEYVTPEYLNNAINDSTEILYYTIVANNIQLSRKLDGVVLEVIYYQRIPPLTKDTDENWVSKKYPDVYVFGLLTEIGAWAKDPDSSQLWDLRFKSALEEISYEDAVDRWSGPTPVMKVM